MLEKTIKFDKKDFKETPTGWFVLKNIKNIDLRFKTGELKDNSLYVGFMCGRINGTTSEKDYKICLNKIKEIVELVCKDKKQIAIITFPEDWMLEDLPKKWQQAVFDKRKESIRQQLSYIG